MSSADRELLGTLFILQGEQLLDNHDGTVDRTVLKPFDLATKADPKNPEIFYKKGLAYTMEPIDGRRLLAGCRAFAKATALRADYFDAWYGWARALFLIADRRGSDQHFFDALDKFAAAEKCSGGDRASFYWLWGHCWRRIADVAGEACDYQQACDKFRQAADSGYDTIDLWNDYGHVLSHLTALLSREDLFQQVVYVYSKAVALDPTNFEAWFNLACSSTCMYELNPNEDNFRVASHAFSEATSCRPDETNAWFYWAQLMLTSGKIERDIGKLKESLPLFARAEELGQTKQSLLYCRWGEALMNCGSFLEELRYLLEAKEKLMQSVELTPDVPEVWYFYGRCIAEIGRYFGEVDYYKEAIKKYRIGQNFEKKFPPFFYGLALAYSEAANITMDVEMLNQSLENFEQLEAVAPPLPSQFWLDWAGVLSRYGEVTHQKYVIERSLEYLEKALLIERESEPESNPLLLDILYHYGCTLDQYGDFCDEPIHYERAIKVLAKVVEVDSNHVNGRYNLAVALTHLGELVNDADCFMAANDQFEIVLKHDPEDAVSWNEWGICLLHWAQLIKDPVNEHEVQALMSHAESKLLQSVALGNVFAYYNMACYHAIQGSVDDAIHFLEKAQIHAALPPVQEIMQDEWLTPLRESFKFRDFLARILHRL